MLSEFSVLFGKIWDTWFVVMGGVTVATEKGQNIQDVFLNHVRKKHVGVTIFLVNGVKLQGNITWFDNFSILLRRDSQSQLIYKHAISTIMPLNSIDLFEESET